MKRYTFIAIALLLVIFGTIANAHYAYQFRNGVSEVAFLSGNYLSFNTCDSANTGVPCVANLFLSGVKSGDAIITIQPAFPAGTCVITQTFSVTDGQILIYHLSTQTTATCSLQDGFYRFIVIR